MAGRSLIGGPAGAGAGLIGRASVLVRLDRSLDTGGAVLAGPGGVGVSALLTAVSRRLRQAGTIVHHRVAGDPLADLLDDLTDPPADPASSVSGPPTRSGFGPTALPVLVLDDAHLLDDPTAAELRRRVLDGGLRCLLGSTDPDGLAAPLAWLWHSGTVARIDLAPFDGATVAGWVAELVGAPPDRSTLDLLLSDSGGLPGLLVDTLGALTGDPAAGSGPGHGGRLTLRSGYARLSGPLPDPVALQARVRRRADGLAPDAREALGAVCLTGRLDPATSMATEAAGAIDELVRRGLLAWGGGPGPRWLRPAVGAVRRVVLADLGPIGIGRTAARLQAEAPDAAPIDRELWAALARPRRTAGATGPAAASVARHLMAERRFDEAEVVARASADRGDLAATVVLAELRSERADWPGAEALLADLVYRRDLDDELRVEAVAELASLWLWDFDRSEVAVQLVRDTAARTGGLGGPGTPALVEITAQAGLIDETVALAAQLDEQHHRPSVKTQGAVALALALHGQLDRAVPLAQENLARCLDPPPGEPAPEPETTLLALTLSLTESGRVDEAAELGATAYEMVGSHPPDVAWMALARGRVAMVRGDLAAADVFGREAEAIFGDLDDVTAWSWALNVQLYVAGVRGQPGRCRDLRRRLAQVGPSGVGFLDADMARSAAWADHALGDTLGARRRLAEAGHRAERCGNRALALVVWHDALRLGDHDVASPALTRLAAQVSGPAGLAVRAHLDALAAGDPASFLVAARAMQASGRTIETAELANQALALGRRRGDRATVGAARTLLEAAVAVCLGASTPLLATGSASLTRREREVAHLAAGGAASRRIAAELGISVRTVDNLLGRAYAKLGIRTRAELADALDPP